MIDHQLWMAERLGKLQDVFGERLLFFGLQGSYLRGEAHAGSDIDAVTVLDHVSHEDLALYRKTVRTMDHAELACGFICGREEMKNWPRHEIIPLKLSTLPLFGELEPLLPPAGEEELKEFVRISTANTWHEVSHRYIYDDEDAHDLRTCYKGSFFILQALYLLRTGKFVPTRRELFEQLTDQTERELICRTLEWDILADERTKYPDDWFSLMERFCKNTLKEVAL